ncbi:MAG: succinate dehydrogenase iron-sulfur subunit [Deltaproteobacteria bacterium]|nr:succinate dehydrogenase iron-sulfur subunit [Deltaproteobacteria bacterium]
MTTIRLKIRRRERPDTSGYWEEFDVPYRQHMNIISALQAIRRSPVNAAGETTKPVVWESNCLEEVCGACTMVINGKVRQACSALVDKLEQPITLEPMSKFPCVRDLIVDRSAMFSTLKKIRAWIPIDGTHNLGPGPKIAPSVQEKAYEYSRCMTCGCCVEACPQFNDRSPFIGAFAFGQVELFNSHPTGALNKYERLDAIMGQGGITDCGNAQNCVRACPKQIPLTDAIAGLGWETTKRAIHKLLK